MKKTIKVKFLDRWLQPHFEPILNQFYNVVETDKPDYVFYSENGHEQIHYDCIRISVTGENLRSDFNFCDYAIGFDHLKFEDRYLRYPLYLLYKEDYTKAKFKHMSIPPPMLEKKTRFCDFIVSNGKANEKRDIFFELLNKYKKVDSGGKYKNNLGYNILDKFKFQSECKFSISFENSSTSGYVTEKLIQASGAKTIPIYWGDPTLGRPIINSGGGFNLKSMINVNDYETLEKAVERVIEIDSNDDLYHSILEEPLFSDNDHEEMFNKNLEVFLKNIFDQPYELAYRRGFGQWRCHMERRNKKYKMINYYVKYISSWLKLPKRLIKNIFKNTK